MKTVFLRLLDAVDKEQALLTILYNPEKVEAGEHLFSVAPTSFRRIPRTAFVYWVSPAIGELFQSFPPLASGDRTANHGGATLDDFRFLRLWSEVPPRNALNAWCPFLKGGAVPAFWSDVLMVALWEDDGYEMKSYVSAVRDKNGWGPQWSAVLNGHEFYGRAGITFPSRPHRRGYFAHNPPGCIFGHNGPKVFCPLDEHWQLLSLLNSSIYVWLLHLLMSRGGPQSAQTATYEVGNVSAVPVPQPSAVMGLELSGLSRQGWSLRRSMDANLETSHAHSLPALLQGADLTLAARAAVWGDRVNGTEAELARIQAEIDARCFDLYGIDEADRRAIMENLSVPTEESVEEAEAEPDDNVDGDQAGSALTQKAGLTAELLSWSIGVAFGRFDLRLATGERAIPPEPDPFDPLPVCSPGMLTGADGLPCATPPPGYPIDIPQDGVLLDDPGHPRDLTASARAVFDVVFGADADARWPEAAGILEPKNHDLRAFVARTFFEQHLKRYSKSRRRAPIYWQLATPSASYSVWLYAHRVTPDTFFHVLHDVVVPKLSLEERKLLLLTQESGPNPTASQRKEIAGPEAFVDELRAFRDEVTRVAPLWKPDLDDGVVLTMAPLWRLVPQHRAWQKELKAAWDSLCAGEYDWAHAAMHFWPERVVPKCATDRSLAIAHGLEEVFWEEDAKGKWAPRKTPLTPVSALIAERISPAVKAALKDLLEAPQNRGSNKGRRKGRADA